MKNKEAYTSIEPMSMDDDSTAKVKKLLSGIRNISLVTTGKNAQQVEVLRITTLPLSAVDSFYVNASGDLVFDLDPTGQAQAVELTDEELEQVKLNAVGAVIEDDKTINFNPNRAQRRQSGRASKSIKGKLTQKLKRR